MMFNTIQRAYDLAEKKNTSLFKLCRENGINFSTITTSNRRNGQLSIYTIELLCNAMGITLSEYFSEAEKSVS